MDCPAFRFATGNLPEAERLGQWRDVVGRTLTGCNPSPLPDLPLAIDFRLAGGTTTRLAHTRLTGTRNNRDRSCLSDGDEDFIFFLQLRGDARIDHNDHRSNVRPGDGVLANFRHTLDTSWPDASVLLVRMDRTALRGVEVNRAVGVAQSAGRPVMRLLRSYARAAWREAMVTGAVEPIVERHVAELIGAACAHNHDAMVAAARPALGPARAVAMREAMARAYANPCLTMRQVAASVGLSERAGYLVFEAAGLDFTDELHAIRLERARERLRISDDRIIDTAFAVGFSDVSHFHCMFKRRYGRTPGEARERNR